MFAGFSGLEPVELTLYTDALVIRGSTRTRQRRVSDILNHAEDPFLILEGVTVDEFGSRGTPMRSEFAQVNLDSVLFAVADAPVEPSAEMRTPKTKEEALISVPPFTVVGTIHLLPTGAGLREAPSELTGRFLPVTDATYWSDRLGEARRPALLVAVNHRRAQIMAPHRVDDPWADVDRPGAAGLGGPEPGAAEPGD